MLLWEIVQTMKELNIPYPRLAHSLKCYLHEVNGSKINHQSKINYYIWPNVHVVSPASALSPLTRSFLVINANSNDSSSVSCVLRCSAFRSRSSYKRRTSTAEVNENNFTRVEYTKPTSSTVQINESPAENPLKCKAGHSWCEL